MATRVIKKYICDICGKNVFVDYANYDDYPEDWKHVAGFMIDGKLIEDICPTCIDEIESEISQIMLWHKKYPYDLYERRINEQNVTDGLSDR